MNIKITEGDYEPRILKVLKKEDKLLTIREIESKTDNISRARISAVLRSLSKCGLAWKKDRAIKEGNMWVSGWRYI